MTDAEPTSLDFVRQIVADDVANGTHDGRVQTRFPPEPNGYLHIGHAKSICLNFGIAQEFGGKCNLRFDDTNPSKEETEYVESIRDSVRWLGFQWDEEHFASDYFGQLYEWAQQLIRQGDAYVDLQDLETIRSQKGTVTDPGTHSPHREQSAEENLSLFEKMKAGEFQEGEAVLRAKIDMGHSNMNLRDPIMYRIKHEAHHRTGEEWCIYPMYDFAHGQSDSIENVTHSICTLEFESRRPLYDWYIEKLGIFPSHQYEFARLNLTYTVMSKRKLLQLVEAGDVSGWDDPRMPTIVGIRRRGYTPEALQSFCHEIGVTKFNSNTDLVVLENALRHDLNQRAERRMVVLDPLKVVITNYPEGQVETLSAVNNPEDESAGSREVPFTRELYIERSDFMEDPPRKFFRLAVGREVRLRWAYFLTCTDVVKDADGNVTELHCTYDPETKGGDAPDGRKVKATLHWVSASEAVPVDVRLYEPLFTKENPSDLEEGEDFRDYLNPDSVKTLEGCMAEPSVAGSAPGTIVQFERQGYFCVDPDSTDERLVYNRAVTLRSSFKAEGKGGLKAGGSAAAKSRPKN